ncbi:MAG: cohesin domain-containing protein [Candidatus Bathyarchaeia archaeon]
MKGKNLLCLAILASLAISIVGIGVMPAKAQYGGESFYFDPASIIGPPPNVGGTFTVTIHISSPANDLFLWVMDIQWDPEVFELVGNPVEGNAIKASGSTTFLWVDIVEGFIDDLSCMSLFGEGVYIPPNPTDLVSLTFKVKKYTFGSDITIPFARWITSGGEQIEPTIVPFHFELPPPPPSGPTAAFKPPTCSVFYVEDEVTFDASDSTGGYDGDDTTVITEYRWDFDGDLVWDVVTANPVTTWTFDTPGDKDITLEVYAPGIPPNVDPRYVETDRETHTIHIIERISVGIDVYTERNGIGIGMPSDAFGPQEEVTVYAKVSYGGEGVPYKLVGFEVKDNAGNVVLTRQAFTDMDGIATFKFRIPWTGMEAEQKFGTWVIYGSVDIAEQIYTDYCPFEFGYIVSITSIRTTDALGVTKGSFGKGEEVYVDIGLKNISFNSKTVLITVTIYDNEGVPIGFMAVPDQTVASGSSSFWNFGIQIPYWRFKGVGTVYVNLFTNYPQNGGVPYCPEKYAVITLS